MPIAADQMACVVPDMRRAKLIYRLIVEMMVEVSCHKKTSDTTTAGRVLRFFNLVLKQKLP
jgi:hypothetical protein